MWKPLLLHTAALVLVLGVALGVAQLVGWDHPLGVAALALALGLLEKLGRLLTKDWVNE